MKIKDFMEKDGYSFYTDDAGGFHVEKGGKEVEPKDVLQGWNNGDIRSLRRPAGDKDYRNCFRS